MPRSPRRRRLIACWAAPLALAVTGCVAERPADPVVLTGADVPRLIGAAPGKVVAFRYVNRWRQAPVQVDERALLDLAKPKNAAPVNHSFLTYTDPNTFTGPDPDAALDADDEIAFMGIDAGGKAPAGEAPPPGVVAGSGVEVEVVDRLGNAMPAHMYLFRQTGSLDPGAGKDYVDYQFKLSSGNYKSTYDLGKGPNPEDSTVTTAFYSRHFSDRWIDDQLKITAPSASAADILDRHKNLFAPGTCVRSEDTFSTGAGAMVANIDGPVRAIRSYMGANSGVYTHREHIFYERRQDVTTFLRVHPISGVMDFYDYSPAASGMTYRHDADPRGVTIDGMPELPTPGPITWETVDGSQGSVGIVHTFTTDIAGFNHTSYYLDKQSPAGGAETQCTGDASSYGASGPWVAQALPNTDPTGGAAKRLEVTRHLFYDSPGKADGPRRKAQVESPLEAEATNWP